MKKLLAFFLPAAAVTAAIGLTVASPSTVSAADSGPVAHTQTRFCGSHCHHHGHYWSCGGCTFYCCGHD